MIVVAVFASTGGRPGATIWWIIQPAKIKIMTPIPRVMIDNKFNNELDNSQTDLVPLLEYLSAKIGINATPKAPADKVK